MLGTLPNFPSDALTHFVLICSSLWLCQAPLSMGILQARKLQWVAMPSPRGSSQPRDWTQVSRIAGGSFTIWATRKPESAGVGSLSLLPGIFLTQEVNWGLLHCRWILYQLSYHLVSHKKEQNCVICKDVDRLRDCHTEWSKSEREKHTY